MEFPNEKKYGWKFPIEADSLTGSIRRTDLETDIKESIIILLNTGKGERLGHPDYGCDLMRFTFETISYGLIKEIKDKILTSLKSWENRIENINIQALTDTNNETGLIFEIQYDIVETGRRGEVLYEFANA